MTNKSDNSDKKPARNFEVISNKARTKVKLQKNVYPLLFDPGEHVIKLNEEYKRGTRNEEVEITNKAKELKAIRIRHTDANGLVTGKNISKMINELDTSLQKSVNTYIKNGDAWMVFRIYFELMLLIGDKINKRIFLEEPEYAQYSSHLIADLESLLMIMTPEEKRGVVRFLLENRSRIYGVYSTEFEEALEDIIVTKIAVTNMAPEMINYTDFSIRQLMERKDGNESSFNPDHFGYILTWFFSFLLSEGFELNEVIDKALEFADYPFMPEWIQKAYFLRGDYESAYKFLASFTEEKRRLLEARSVDFGPQSRHFAMAVELFLNNSLYDDSLERFEEALKIYLDLAEPKDLSDLLLMYQEYGDRETMDRLVEMVYTSEKLPMEFKKASLRPLNIDRINFEFFKSVRDLAEFKRDYEDFLDKHSKEVMRIYLGLVIPMASAAKKRSEYKTLANHLLWGINHLQDGRDQAEKVARLWRSEYPRKYAFHDELRKAGFLKDI